MLDMLLGGEEKTHEALYWEMEGQTAIRQGDYKLVLNGRLVEGEEPRAPLFLSDLRTDPGERHNLAEEQPERAEQMRRAALQWREGIERTWKEQFAGNYQCLT